MLPPIAATDDCHAHARCENTAGGFACACDSGYQGDGEHCDDVDECALGSHDCDAHAQCATAPGGFTCT